VGIAGYKTLDKSLILENLCARGKLYPLFI
jgi:hypothetical protein